METRNQLSQPELIQINKWSETFENADSRKRQRLGFYYMPSGCDSAGYLALMSEFEQAEAWQAYGIFVALCQQAATMKREVRGRFVNSDNKPMTTRQIAMLIRCDHDVLLTSLQILKDQRIGWVSASHLPPICQSSASRLPLFSENSSIVQGQGQGQGEGKGQGQGQEKAEPQQEGVDRFKTQSETPTAMDALKIKINALRNEWQSPATWSYSEEQHLFNGASKQMAELDEDDWQTLQRFFKAHLDNAKAYWRPNSRSKFVESFADVWASCQRWRGKSKPTNKNHGKDTIWK
jgi:hypothetical protein